MALVNEFFLELPRNNMFATIAQEVKIFKVIRPSSDLIDLSVNDVTNSLAAHVIKAMHSAVDEMADEKTFHGYGPEQGYSFLRELIIKNDFNSRGIHLSTDEVFINDGIKSEIGNIGELLCGDNAIGVSDPIYPVYVESNVISGRAGIFVNGHWSNVIYLDGNENNGFVPQIPDRQVDIVYLCSPNNPTGMAFSKSQLKKWVDYALKNNVLILFDATYEAYIQAPNIPHSIYEIRGAKKVAIELRSFSRTAGFTGMRCGYTVIPNELHVQNTEGNSISMNQLWNRRQSIRFNGVSYVTQCAAAAIYTDEGKAEIRKTIDYYMRNVMLMRRELAPTGVRLFGGEHVPYLWMKVPAGVSSYDYFKQMLYGANVVCTPGTAFGPSGEGYVRLSAFASHTDCCNAVERLKHWL